MFLAYEISQLELSCFFVLLFKYFQRLCGEARRRWTDGASWTFLHPLSSRPMERRRGASQLKTKPALRLDLEPQHKQQVAPRRVLLRAAEAQPVLGCGRRVALAASLHRGVAAVAGQFDGSRRDVALQVRRVRHT